MRNSFTHAVHVTSVNGMQPQDSGGAITISQGESIGVTVSVPPETNLFFSLDPGRSIDQIIGEIEIAFPISQVSVVAPRREASASR